MNRQSVPLSFVIAQIVLAITIFCGTVNVSEGLGQWNVSRDSPLLLNLIGQATAFVVLPLMAIYDTFRRRQSGRYLALLSLMLSWGLLLRFLSGIPADTNVGITLILLSFAGLWAALILTFGFSKKVNSFFNHSSDSAVFVVETCDIRQPVSCLDESAFDGQAELPFENKILEPLAFGDG